MKRVPMTAPGAQRLRAELEQLKSVKRPAVINAIAEARAHGDLKENAEYHASSRASSRAGSRSWSRRCRWPR
jgi:transcription elongation factor GreA